MILFDNKIYNKYYKKEAEIFLYRRKNEKTINNSNYGSMSYF